MRKGLVVFGLALVLAVTNVAIMQKERLLARGTPMLVELAPVDPRALIQGDYMRLEYAMNSELSVLQRSRALPSDGRVVVTLDGNGVARFVRVHVEGTPLAPAERLLQYRDRAGRIRIGTDAFYFQEGHADRYEAAKYGELRVDRSGGSVLVGLRDTSLRVLK